MPLIKLKPCCMKNNLRPTNHHSQLMSFIKKKQAVIGLFLGTAGLFFSTVAGAQTNSRLAQAEAYFAAGEYYTAAHLYEQMIHPPRGEKTPTGFPLNSKKGGKSFASNLAVADLMFRQAECYRLARYWPEAAALYRSCFEQDAGKYAAALYWYAVCQRSLGNDTAALTALDRFAREHAGHALQPDAQKELQTVRFIQEQKARPDSVLYRVAKMHMPGTGSAFAAVTSANNNYLFSAPQKVTVASGINPNRNRLFYGTPGDSILHGLNIEGLDTSLHQGAASLSSDGLHLYLTQWTKQAGQKKAAIYHTVKKEGGWSRPELLSSVNEAGFSSQQPFCSADGKYLFFASNRPGGLGGFDIWMAALQSDGSTGPAIHAGSIINSAANEEAPFYHQSEKTLVFASDRAPGMGGYDLFFARGELAEWQVPQNPGHPVNSSRDDLYFSARQDGSLLDQAIISSDRGSECCLATYTIHKAAKKQWQKGRVLDCANGQPLPAVKLGMSGANGLLADLTTDSDGVYSVPLEGKKPEQLILNKEGYDTKTAALQQSALNESAWHTDTVLYADICLQQTAVIKVENVVTVFFEFDKSALNERAMLQVDSIYQVLISDTTATVQIAGYTDGKGSVAYNKKLSDKRAKACADYLQAKGIAAERINLESFGACCPLQMEQINGRDNPDGRSVNRRALINVRRQ